MKRLSLIGFFLSLFVMGMVIGANAQRKITETYVDERGLVSVIFTEKGVEGGMDYLTVEQFNAEFKDKWTGDYYTGIFKDRYPVLLSVNGKRFVIRKSAKGIWYRYYLQAPKS